jgi:site-specific DNA recombinase
VKAVAYARFSSDNQREESITAQLRIIRDYAEKHSIHIIREYTDEAKSATTDDRPQFLQMIKDINIGIVKVDYVLIHKYDRFARNRYDSAIYKHQLQSKGVKLIAVDQPLDGSPESVILEALLESMAEYYSLNLAREVQKGMRETALQAKHTGGKPALGYDVDKETHKYTVNEHEAETVRIIYQKTIEGVGYSKIIDLLNGAGRKTKNGKPFGKNSIYEILKNERYTGTYIFNRAASKTQGKRNNHTSKPDDQIIRIPDAIPAIVPRFQWEEVQKIMNDRKAVAPRNRKTIFILTGKMFCGCCESAYVGNSKTSGRNKTRYHFYCCTRRKQTRDCDNKSIRKEIVENYILDEIERRFSPANSDEWKQLVKKRYVEMIEETEGERQYIEKKLDEIQQKMDRIMSGIENGHMEAAVFGPRLNQLSAEKEILLSTARDLELRSALPLTDDQIDNFLEANKKALSERQDLEACRRLVNMYVHKIIVYPDDFKPIYKFDPQGDLEADKGRYAPPPPLKFTSYLNRDELLKKATG